MGRGASKLKVKLVKSATTQSGVVADLTDTPLVYGKKDSNVSAAQRKTLEAQEKKRLNAKIEYGLVVDASGNIVGGEVKGGRGRVRMPYLSMMTVKGIMTHNHPRGKGSEGVIGGTFSPQDITTFSKRPLKTMRASAAEGTYSITKTQKYDAAGTTSYIKSLESGARSELNKTFKQIQSDYNSRKISGAEYTKRARKANNKYLVDLHNGLLAGQKTYGYQYTLEER